MDNQSYEDGGVPPSEPGDGPLPGKPCQICKHGETSAHHNFGASSCFSCRAFFRRLVTKHKNPRILCQFSSNCDVTGENRNNCRRCRFEACLKAGMNPDLVLDVNQRKERLIKLGTTPKVEGTKKTVKRPINGPGAAPDIVESQLKASRSKMPALTLAPRPEPLDKVRPVTLAPVIDSNLMASGIARAKAVADANPLSNPRRIVDNLWQHRHMDHKVLSLKLAWKMADDKTERPNKLKIMHMITCYPTKIYEPQSLIAKHYKELCKFLENFANSYPSFSELSESDRDAVLEQAKPVFFTFLMFKTLATGLSAWLTLDRERYGSDKPNSAISITSIGELMAMPPESVGLQGRMGVTFSTMRFKAFELKLEHLELIAHACIFSRQQLTNPNIMDMDFMANVEKDNTDVALNVGVDPELLRDATLLCHQISHFWPTILGTATSQSTEQEPGSRIAEYEENWLDYHARAVERKSKEFAPSETFIRDLMGLRAFGTPFPYDPCRYLHNLWQHKIVNFLSDSDGFCSLPPDNQQHLCRLNCTLGFALQVTQLENASTFGEQLQMLASRHFDENGPEGFLPPGADDGVMKLPAIRYKDLMMSRYLSPEQHAAMGSELPTNAPFLADKKTAAGLLLFLLITNLDTFLASKGKTSHEGDKYLQAVRRRLQREEDISQERLNKFLLEISQFWQICDNIFNET